MRCEEKCVTCTRNEKEIMIRPQQAELVKYLDEKSLSTICINGQVGINWTKVLAGKLRYKTSLQQEPVGQSPQIVKKEAMTNHSGSIPIYRLILLRS